MMTNLKTVAHHYVGKGTYWVGLDEMRGNSATEHKDL